MATSLVINGVSYAYPDTGDQSWGTVASAWAAAVTSGMLQKAGGTFTLTGNVNFGNSFGLISKFFSSNIGNPASTGVFRLGSADSIAWRNNADNADILFAKDTSNQLSWGGVSFLGSNARLLAVAFPAMTGDVTNTAGSVNTHVVAIAGTTVNGTTGIGNVVFHSGPSMFNPTITGQLTSSAITGTAPFVVSSTTRVANLNVATAGTADNVVDANLTGVITSTGTVTALTAQTGTGSTVVVDNGPTLIAPVLGSATGTSLALSGNSSANNFIEGYTTIATAAATTTLTVSSTHSQFFTGSTTQTVVLPDATTVALGHQFFIVNSSSGSVTVNKNGGTLVQVMSANSFMVVTATNIGSAAGAWTASYSTNNSGGGTVTSVTFTGDGTVFSSTPTAPVTTTGTLAAALNTQSANTYLGGPLSGSAAAPTFKTFTAPTITKLTSTGTATGFLFTISTSTAAAGDTYTKSGNTYTVLNTFTSQFGVILYTSGTVTPTATGTLARATGSGSATINYSAVVPLATFTTATNPAPLTLEVELVGGGGGACQSSGGVSGSDATHSVFGVHLMEGLGGFGAAGPGDNGVIGGQAFLGSGPIGFAVNGGASESGKYAASSLPGAGGNGGSSAFGGAGAGAGSGGTDTPGGNASSMGGAGGGGPSGTTNSDPGGTGGSAGGYVKATITSSIAATYYYAVGLKGLGGTGGGIASGGDGGDGFILITQRYQ